MTPVIPTDGFRGRTVESQASGGQSGVMSVQLESVSHRCQIAAIGAGQAAMVYVFAAPAHPPAWLPPAIAVVLVVCALVYGRQLIAAA
jgi:hypothetical protein